MNARIRSALEKARSEKARGHYDKALRRLEDALRREPGDLELYIEAADACLEAGEPLQATSWCKRAATRLPAERERIHAFARERMRAMSDPVLGRYLLVDAVKRRAYDEALSTLEDLPDHTVRDLLRRIRTKRQSLGAAERGGYSMRGERLTHDLCEAVLDLRLERFTDAARVLMAVLEEKPVENETLEPFVAAQEKAHPKVARLRLVYAMCLATSNHPVQAMERIVRAARLDPALAGEGLDLARSLCERFDERPPEIDRALAELLILDGAAGRAAEILAAQLEARPSSARAVMELIDACRDAAGDDDALEAVYLDAARVLEQFPVVARRLRERASRHGAEAALAWLESRSREGFFPVDVMELHAELALEAGRPEEAAEILRAVVATAPGEVARVEGLIERAPQDHPAIEALRESIAGAHATSTPAASGMSDDDDAFEFENFDRSGFSFSSNRDEIEMPTSAPTGAEPTGLAQVRMDAPDPTPHGDATASGRPVLRHDQLERAAGAPAVDDPAGGDAAAAPQDAGRPPRDDAPPRPPATASFVEAVADALYDSGAATFFHIEADEPATDADAPDGAVLEPHAPRIDPEPAPVSADDAEPGGAEPVEDAPPTDAARRGRVDVAPAGETVAPSRPRTRTRPAARRRRGTVVTPEPGILQKTTTLDPDA